MRNTLSNVTIVDYYLDVIAALNTDALVLHSCDRAHLTSLDINFCKRERLFKASNRITTKFG